MTIPSRKRLKTLVGAGAVIAAGNDTDPRTGIRRAAGLAQLAEKEKITGLFTADLLQADPAGLAGTTGSQEPVVALAALSQVTSDIGLIATVSTTYQHPYNLARLIGTLDHVSGGRAGWNAVTSSVGEENFGEVTLPSPEARYARATEFIEVINALFDSNDPAAAQRTAGGGIRIDPQKLHPVHYQGDVFRVQGPLNVPPPPQRRPVQFQAGQSEQGLTLGARYAEVIYTSQPTLEAALTFVEQVRRRARDVGRVEGLPLIMNSFHSVIGENDADVARRVREKHERIDYLQGRLKVADMLGGDIDLRDLPLDQPVPAHWLPQVAQVNRRRGRAEIFRRFALQGLTLRELIIEAQETGHWHVAGTPETLADAIEARYRAGVLDVISLHGLGQPDQEDLLLNGLLPELRKRQLLDEDYPGEDFRTNLGLPPVTAGYRA
ncbi:LLM class flavin-dependent oxidoreductase [Chimaeribacter californicus]|uniref:LLM class flavin-dependent oxidoreductase n=1 Tax=Chimaeribacter californicus TaxID=2060067 RepID=A0A2N5DUZ7_9GAMM|nr:NtaA/DmoA family FMN-dependent monooxygenase [Chimaeribacter californicus]PLR30819.1 LLM class flavin-dependent oxidoreductase [Chimaeribacter californicus]